MTQNDDRQPDKVEAAMRLLKGLTDIDLAEVLKQGMALKESRDSRLRAMGLRVIGIGYKRELIVTNADLELIRNAMESHPRSKPFR